MDEACRGGEGDSLVELVEAVEVGVAGGFHAVAEGSHEAVRQGEAEGASVAAAVEGTFLRQALQRWRSDLGQKHINQACLQYMFAPRVYL